MFHFVILIYEVVLLFDSVPLLSSVAYTLYSSSVLSLFFLALTSHLRLLSNDFLLKYMRTKTCIYLNFLFTRIILFPFYTFLCLHRFYIIFILLIYVYGVICEVLYVSSVWKGSSIQAYCSLKNNVR